MQFSEVATAVFVCEKETASATLQFYCVFRGFSKVASAVSRKTADAGREAAAAVFGKLQLQFLHGTLHLQYSRVI